MTVIARDDVIRAAEEQAEAYRDRPFSERVAARADFMETLDAYVAAQLQGAVKTLERIAGVIEGDDSATAKVRMVRALIDSAPSTTSGGQSVPVDLMMRESRIARARGLAQAIAECRDDARLDGIREGAAEIVTLLERREEV